jgi:quercetin dioxygenase-like cupin family protein
VWRVSASAQARINVVEVRGTTAWHFHPDAAHRLFVVSGTVIADAGTQRSEVAAGSVITIPAGVRHRYSVNGGPALLLSMDAPPYDPAKTVALE